MNPLEVPTCITMESWNAFLEVRKRKGQRAPLTEYAMRLIWKKLIDADRQGYDAQYMIDQAIERGWTSVFVGADTPKVNRQADETKRMLDSQKSAEGPAPEVKARILGMLGKLRRVA